MDSRLNQNESELRVLVLSVSLQVLSNGNSLLNQEVKVLWDLWGKTVRLQDSENLVTSDNLSLRNTVSISEQDTNLRWGQTLLSVLEDLLNNSVRRELEPSWSVSGVWKSGRGDTLTLLRFVSIPLHNQVKSEQQKEQPQVKCLTISLLYNLANPVQLPHC